LAHAGGLPDLSLKERPPGHDKLTRKQIPILPSPSLPFSSLKVAPLEGDRSFYPSDLVWMGRGLIKRGHMQGKRPQRVSVATKPFNKKDREWGRWRGVASLQALGGLSLPSSWCVHQCCRTTSWLRRRAHRENVDRGMWFGFDHGTSTRIRTPS